MAFFSKKKEKPLEELAKEFGITLSENSLGEDYEHEEVRSSGSSSEEALRNLLTRAQGRGVKYMSHLGATNKNTLGRTRYNSFAIVYHPNQDPFYF